MPETVPERIMMLRCLERSYIVEINKDRLVGIGVCIEIPTTDNSYQNISLCRNPVKIEKGKKSIKVIIPDMVEDLLSINYKKYKIDKSAIIMKLVIIGSIGSRFLDSLIKNDVLSIIMPQFKVAVYSDARVFPSSKFNVINSDETIGINPDDLQMIRKLENILLVRCSRDKLSLNLAWSEEVMGRV